jgi:biopolymer transport protein ExbD
MSAKKPKRSAPSVDMTAMVDVAFLLLTFFILTTTNFREDKSAEVDTPSSVSQKEMKAEGFMIIHVTDSGKVFAGYTDIDTREKVIGRVLDKYAPDDLPKLTEEGMNFFTSVENFGVPVAKLVTFLNMEDDERASYTQEGIPVTPDSLTNQLAELKYWVGEGRRSDPGMNFAIKGDASAPYPVVREVITVLQDYNINRMSLITEMEDPPSLDEMGN